MKQFYYFLIIYYKYLYIINLEIIYFMKYGTKKITKINDRSILRFDLAIDIALFYYLFFFDTTFCTSIDKVC